MTSRSIFINLFLLIVTFRVGLISAQPLDFKDIQISFIREMVEQQGFDQVSLENLLKTAVYQKNIIDTISRPYESKPWNDYRALFLTPERIAGGVKFFAAHEALLTRAAQIYGVDPAIIVAILGVETFYGANTGRYRTIDALTTLGFGYPPRADFFRNELKELLILAREEQLDPKIIIGSYAGALGKPQFIPSSYRKYALDFDQDGHRDLWNSDPDVIGSVANYFQLHGWRSGEPIAVPVQLMNTIPAGVNLAEKTPVLPSLTISDLRKLGILGIDNLSDLLPAILLRCAGDHDEYWVILNNFYVITRYNQSNWYALAVYQLSEAIRRGLASNH